jgi:transposase
MGLASLPNQPRCGAPSKLNEAHRTRLKGVDGEPLTCRVLVRRLVAEYGITISANTLRNELKRTGYV